MKKYYLILLMSCCLGLINFSAFAEWGGGRPTCCDTEMIEACPQSGNPCCDSDCKDIDLSGDYGGMGPDVERKKECCTKLGGQNIADPRSTGTYVCCSAGSSKKLTGSYDKSCCSGAGGQPLDGNKCCSKWGFTQLGSGNLPMCKK